MESPKGVWIKLNINGDKKETKDHESLERKMSQTLQEKWYKLSLDNGFSYLEKEGDSKLLTDFLNINLKKNYNVLFPCQKSITPDCLLSGQKQGSQYTSIDPS